MKVLITGASSGIGYECAKMFAMHGHDLVLVARRLDRLNEIKKELNVNVEVIELDVTNREDVLKKLENLFVDVLINNAGLALGKDHLANLDLQDMDKMIDTNVKGVVNVTRAILKNMKKNNKGHIVFVGSTAAIQGYEGGSIYCATKAAVKTIADALRIELINTDLRVTNIQPGIVKTDFSLVRFKGDENAASKVYEGVDALRPSDIANIIYFTCSLENRVQISEMTIMANKQATGTMIYKGK